jgi:uncharacterized protein (DUF1800 family)
MISGQWDFSGINLRLRYDAGKYSDGREYLGVDEYRPLSLLDADLPALFPYTGNGDQIPLPERSRPLMEVQMANLLQMVATRDPWKEEWVSFWRDHFSIYGYDGTVRAFVPHWERTVIREHCWGNFSEMLKASAKHPCMLYYLNNQSSRAGSANENYARELFELHTLGRAAYLNSLYAEWKKVPGALQGKPDGYVDEDVYEAARAFTGWTVENGAGIGGGQSLPKTGRFTYVDAWHDNYQKRIMAKEFSSYAGPMQDGHRALDLCASHPATAHHLATKIVRRLVSDKPPPALIKSTTQVFRDNQRSPQQLILVYEHLVREAQKIPLTARQKVRSPRRLVAAFAQAVSLEPSLVEGRILGPINNAASSLYGWRSPDGPPDAMNAHLSSAYLRGRLQLIQGLAENWWATGDWNPFDGLPTKRTYTQLLERWETPLFGIPRPELRETLLASQNTKPNDAVTDVKLACRLVGLLACSPSFQTESMLPTPQQWQKASGRSILNTTKAKA